MATRNRSNAHPGVSYKMQPSGRYRLRWPGGSARLTKTPDEIERLAIEAYQTVKAGKEWTPPDETLKAPTRVQSADLKQMFLRWLAWRRDTLGRATRTIKIQKGCIIWVESQLRDIHGLGDDAAIPCDLLTIGLCEELNKRLAADPEKGKGRAAQIMRCVHDAWTYGASDPARWVGIGPVPPNKKLVIPEAPKVRERKNTKLLPPTIAETDAILTRALSLASPEAADVLALCSRTGARINHVLTLRRGDIDFVSGRIEWPPWKHNKEGFDQPIAPCILPVLTRLCADIDVKDRERRLFVSQEIHDGTLGKLMQACEDAGEIRPRIWRRTRIREGEKRKRRLSHWARAGYQGFFKGKVRKAVLAELVDHDAEDVSDETYIPAEWEELQAAVEMLPALPDGFGPPSHVFDLDAERKARTA